LGKKKLQQGVVGRRGSRLDEKIWGTGHKKNGSEKKGGGVSNREVQKKLGLAMGTASIMEKLTRWTSPTGSNGGTVDITQGGTKSQENAKNSKS